ncbi:MAG: protein kinase [Acidobacteriota bacterium]
MPLAVGQRLGTYQIVAPLGAGGMGEVYRARDTKLDRDVAIKVLPQSMAGDPESLARFEREAKAVAALSHPNILAIFDFGTHDGTAYAVTELLEGETLREKLIAGTVSRKQAVDYALQIASGLSAAHERGIVHRDLKPENLFLTKDGRLKILDFGLAKRVEAAAPGDETGARTLARSAHTEPGIVLGTLGYMSPEQVRGLPVDHRSDIFSFGAILYEVLSGRRAFKKDTASDTIAAILTEEPPDIPPSGSALSPALDHIVRHCLEKNRENRFQSVRDVAFTLSEASGPSVAAGAQNIGKPGGNRRVLIAVGVLAVLAALTLFSVRRYSRRAGEARGVTRVAVLPFENMGSPEDDYFADGIADAVRGKLTTVPGIEVIARGSSIAYKKTAKSSKKIAEELDARYLLTATVRWQKSEGASRVQVNPELVEVKESGAPASKWQQPFDAALTDVFQVQSDIASRVAQALGVALGAGEEKRLSEAPTQNLPAYDAFLKGEEASKSLALDETPGLRKSLVFYEQAVAIDPGFAQAWAQISRASSRLYEISTPTPELAERARQAAERAAALAPTRPEGHLALGNYQHFVLRDLAGAVDRYAEGRRLSPGNADLLAATAFAEENLGRWETSIEHFHQAERLDPRSVLTQTRLGEALLWLRRGAEARQSIDRGVALAPSHLDLIELKAMTFLVEGDLAGARAVLRAAPKEVEPKALVSYVATYWDLVWVLDEEQRGLLLRLTPSAFDEDRGAWGLCMAQAYALKGEAANARTAAEVARNAFQEQLLRTPGDYQRHILLGLAFAYLGRKEEAIREAEREAGIHRITRDAYSGPYYQHQQARIYMLVGEPEKALDKLEPLLKIPYFLSPGWLRIDPNFDTLRRNPRFQKLAAGEK